MSLSSSFHCRQTIMFLNKGGTRTDMLMLQKQNEVSSSLHINLIHLCRGIAVLPQNKCYFPDIAFDCPKDQAQMVTVHKVTTRGQHSSLS